MVALPWFAELELSWSGSSLMLWVQWFVPGKYRWSWGSGELCPPWQRIFEAVTLCSQVHTATRIIDMPCYGLLELNESCSPRLRGLWTSILLWIGNYLHPKPFLTHKARVTKSASSTLFRSKETTVLERLNNLFLRSL